MIGRRSPMRPPTSPDSAWPATWARSPSRAASTAEVYARSIPVFDGVLDSSGGASSPAPSSGTGNRPPLRQRPAGVSEEFEDLLYDPQTSGGLLISVRETKAAAVLARRSRRRVSARLPVIGRVIAQDGQGKHHPQGRA